MADVIKLRILIFDYIQRRRRCEDGAERDLKMLALKIGVMWGEGRSADSHQKLEEAMNFSPRVFRGRAALLTP